MKYPKNVCLCVCPCPDTTTDISCSLNREITSKREANDTQKQMKYSSSPQ